MGITFHCEYCGKKIQASDNSGGKWGKCPSCHNRIYVPNLETTDELKLAPIDESEEEKQKRLMAETHKLTQDILLERAAPEESEEEKAARPAPAALDKKLIKIITTYLRQMADGKLDRAEKTAAAIISCGNKAAEILDQMAAGEISEPELADIPEQVLSGLLRELREKIG